MSVEHAYLVLGCGYFGLKAVDALIKEHPSAKITVVDKNPRKLGNVSSTNCRACEGDALEYLDRTVNGSSMALWVVPAVPIHLAYEWLLNRLSGKTTVKRRAKRIPVPVGLDLGLPFQVRSEQGTLYCSYADFGCPDDCPEPVGYCTVTGMTREKPLYEVLEGIEYNGYRSFVIRSRQLAPGVGGYTTGDLVALFEKVSSAPGQGALVSTSCRCHAVMDGLHFDEGY